MEGVLQVGDGARIAVGLVERRIDVHEPHARRLLGQGCGAAVELGEGLPFGPANGGEGSGEDDHGQAGLRGAQALDHPSGVLNGRAGRIARPEDVTAGLVDDEPGLVRKDDVVEVAEDLGAESAAESAFEDGIRDEVGRRGGPHPERAGAGK